MRGLRSSLCWLYGFVAVMLGFSWAAGFMRHSHRAAAHSGPAVLAQLFLPVCVIIFGMTALAWWRRSPAVRAWGIAAGVLNLVVCVAMTVVLRRLTHASWMALLEEQALLLALGIASLMAFWNWDPGTEFAQSKTSARRIPGDGRHLLLDWLPGTIAVIGYYFGLRWWWGWGASQHLHWRSGDKFWMLVVSASLIVTFVHECGHAVVARLAGMQLHGFVAGPLQWRADSGRWRFAFNWSGFITAEGVTRINLNDPALKRWPAVAMIAAGPFANLVFGAAAVLATLRAPGRPWSGVWMFLACIATFSLSAFVANLIPARTSGTYTDGAKIYQLLSGHTLIEFSLAGSLGLRKRGLDCLLAGKPAEAEGYFRQALGDGISGPREERVRILVCLADALQDQGRLREAQDYLESALALGDETGSGQGSMADVLLLLESDPRRALAMAEEAERLNAAYSKSDGGRQMSHIRLLARRTVAMLQMGERNEAERSASEAMGMLDQALQASAAARQQQLRPAEMLLGRAHSVVDDLLLAYSCLKIGRALVQLQDKTHAAKYLRQAQELSTSGKIRAEAQRELAGIGAASRPLQWGLSRVES